VPGLTAGTITDILPTASPTNEGVTMPDEDPDPQTAAMLAGAEIEKGSDDDGVEHHPRTHPVDLPVHPAGNVEAPLTTDDDAQVQDSVVQPDNS
jgi:hypothetical protein